MGVRYGQPISCGGIVPAGHISNAQNASRRISREDRGTSGDTRQAPVRQNE